MVAEWTMTANSGPEADVRIGEVVNTCLGFFLLRAHLHFRKSLFERNPAQSL